MCDNAFIRVEYVGFRQNRKRHHTGFATGWQNLRGAGGIERHEDFLRSQPPGVGEPPLAQGARSGAWSGVVQCASVRPAPLQRGGCEEFHHMAS